MIIDFTSGNDKKCINCANLLRRISKEVPAGSTMDKWLAETYQSKLIYSSLINGISGIEVHDDMVLIFALKFGVTVL